MQSCMVLGAPWLLRLIIISSLYIHSDWQFTLDRVYILVILLGTPSIWVTLYTITDCITRNFAYINLSLVAQMCEMSSPHRNVKKSHYCMVYNRLFSSARVHNSGKFISVTAELLIILKNLVSAKILLLKYLDHYNNSEHISDTLH